MHVNGRPSHKNILKDLDTLTYDENEIRRIAVKGFDIAMKRRRKVTSVDTAAHLPAALGHNVRCPPALCQNLLHGILNGLGLPVQVKAVAQHHGGAQNRSDGICHILSRNIRGG